MENLKKIYERFKALDKKKRSYLIAVLAGVWTSTQFEAQDREGVRFLPEIPESPCVAWLPLHREADKSQLVTESLAYSPGIEYGSSRTAWRAYREREGRRASMGLTTVHSVALEAAFNRKYVLWHNDDSESLDAASSCLMHLPVEG